MKTINASDVDSKDDHLETENESKRKKLFKNKKKLSSTKKGSQKRQICNRKEKKGYCIKY